jgi:hypothetical protein
MLIVLNITQNKISVIGENIILTALYLMSDPLFFFRVLTIFTPYDHKKCLPVKDA